MSSSQVRLSDAGTFSANSLSVLTLSGGDRLTIVAYGASQFGSVGSKPRSTVESAPKSCRRPFGVPGKLSLLSSSRCCGSRRWFCCLPLPVHVLRIPVSTILHHRIHHSHELPCHSDPSVIGRVPNGCPPVRLRQRVVPPKPRPALATQSKHVPQRVVARLGQAATLALAGAHGKRGAQPAVADQMPG